MSHDPRARADDSGAVQALRALGEQDLTLAAGLSKYRLVGALGHGGMADVYLAVADGPQGFRKLCVLKLLKDNMSEDEEFRAMFLDEARLAARLNHPNIVQTFEVGETHNRMMIAMEYVEGQPATRLRRRLTPEQFPLSAHIAVLCDVLDALEYAHSLTDFDGSSLSIVHRDVSPHNVIIGYDARVKLLDFGIAKSRAATQETQAGVLKGKVGYMAPEQASMRALDGRADIFSVGVMLWEAIAGRRLAEGMPANDVLVRRVSGQDPKIIEVVPDVDPELAAICDRAMALSADDRYATAAELQGELEQWLGQHTEPNRKGLSKALRDAFAREREQLRALVEQRMADGAMSGVRQALLGEGGFPSLGRFHGGGGTESSPFTPAKGTAASLRSSEAVPGPLAGAPSTASFVEGAANSTLITGAAPAAPHARRTGLPAVVFVALGLFALVAIAAAAYTRRTAPAVAGGAGSSEVGAEPRARESATVATAASPSLSAPPTRAASVTSDAPPGPDRRTAPAFPTAPIGKPPLPVAHPVAPAAPPVIHPVAPPPAHTVPSALSSPATNKSSRPLDEKDPYAQ
jgi:hypothetical protein